MRDLLGRLIPSVSADKPFAIALAVAFGGVAWSWIYLALLIARWIGNK